MSLIKKRIYLGKYDVDNVRFTVKNFVRDFNEFYALHGRPPVDSIDGEHAFYLKWCTYRNPNNLNAEEVEYVDKNLVKMGNINWKMKQFVEEYNAFILFTGREPCSSAVETKELSLYKRYIYYTRTRILTEEEKKYLEDNGILCADEVRKTVKKFVKELLEFIDKQGRLPKHSSNKKFHSKYCRYTQASNLSESEIKYLQEHGIQVKVKNVQEKNL